MFYVIVTLEIKILLHWFDIFAFWKIIIYMIFLHYNKILGMNDHSPTKQKPNLLKLSNPQKNYWLKDISSVQIQFFF